MEVQTTFLALLMCLISSNVLSFSVGRRKVRSTDLAQALSILQRQRRRIGGDDYFSSERLLDNGPTRLGDVSDWLSETRDPNDIDDAWENNREKVTDYNPRDPYNNYDILSLLDDIPDKSQNVVPYGVQASKQDLENIFDVDTGSIPEHENIPDLAVKKKKKKEEMVNVKEYPKPVEKKSTSGETLSLDSLTKEELKALMKAVGKLEKQANNVDSEENDEFKSPTGEALVKETRVKESSAGREVEQKFELVPADKDELESVFGDYEKPAVQETQAVKVNDAGEPEEVLTKTIETEYIPLDEKSGESVDREIAEEIVSDLENGMRDNSLADINDVARKRFDGGAFDNRNENSDDREQSEGISNINPKDLEALENYWLLNAYLDKPSGPSKRSAKRSTGIAESMANAGDYADDVKGLAEEDEDEDSTDGESDVLAELRSGSIPSVEAFVAKILELQEELDQLRMVARLEDIENDELTEALNEATQVQRASTVSDFEFNALQKAIRIEEALQDIKKKASKNNNAAVMSKKAEPWRRKRKPDNADTDIALSPRMSGYNLEPVKREGKSPSKADIERLLGQSYILQDEDEDSLGDDLYRDNDGVVDSREVASLFLPKADQCPSVRQYSTNCELADLYSLPVDNEARALCNLHEVCYACGKSLSVSQSQCDMVYRAAAEALCGDKQSCLLESEIFLRTMKLKTRYVPHTQPMCRHSCTHQFLGML